MAYQLYYDGFDSYSSITDLPTYEYVDYTGILSTNAGRRGSKCFIGNSSYSRGLARSIVESTHVVLGFALKLNNSGNDISIGLYNNTTPHIQLIVRALSRINLYAGGNLVGTSTKVFPTDTYMYIEIGSYINNTSGSYEVRVNGSSIGWFPYTSSVDTQNGATNTITGWSIIGLGGGGVSHTIYVDDIYCTYGDELKYFGDSRIDKLLLSGNSSPQEWTANSGLAWERLNAGDGYVSSNVDEATSYFTVADLDFDPTVIHALQVKGKARKSDAGLREIAFLTKSNSVEVESNNMVLSTDPLSFVHILETDPSTNTAWTSNNINNVEVGMRVKV